MNRKFHVLFLILAIGVYVGCSTDGEDDIIPGADSDGDSDGDGDSDTDTDGDADSDADSDTDSDADSDSDTDTDADPCNGVLPVIYRDFTAEHADMQTMYPGDDGPELSCQGMVEPTLGADGKPVFVQGTCEERSRTFVHIDNEDSFNQWYNDVEDVNQRLEKSLTLTSAGAGIFIFESETFFPLGNDEGFGAEDGQLDINEELRNFLFTTEIHTRFKYEGGETFSFRGDDDLWLFIDGTLAIDIGGLHFAEEKELELDTLGLTAGEMYDMDIFHAERHTTDSNFKITTSINCFVTIE